MPVYALIIFGVSKYNLQFVFLENCSYKGLHTKRSQQRELFADNNFIISLQCYSLATIGYRVATFNDCVEASESLKQVRSLNLSAF